MDTKNTMFKFLKRYQDLFDCLILNILHFSETQNESEVQFRSVSLPARCAQHSWAKGHNSTDILYVLAKSSSCILVFLSSSSPCTQSLNIDWKVVFRPTLERTSIGGQYFRVKFRPTWAR